MPKIEKMIMERVRSEHSDSLSEADSKKQREQGWLFKFDIRFKAQNIFRVAKYSSITYDIITYYVYVFQTLNIHDVRGRVTPFSKKYLNVLWYIPIKLDEKDSALVIRLDGHKIWGILARNVTFKALMTIFSRL